MPEDPASTDESHSPWPPKRGLRIQTGAAVCVRLTVAAYFLEWATFLTRTVTRLAVDLDNRSALATTKLTAPLGGDHETASQQYVL